MNRRHFLATLAAIAAAASLRAQSPNATLTFQPGPSGPTIPHDFTGLSYESAQLANPTFFSAANKPLVALFRGLSPSGVLRLGGGSSEYTTYSDADPTGPPPFEVFGPDTSKTVKHGTITSALALRNLRAFLDATGWTCIYGLNLGQGTKENAAAEAAAVTRILGPRLLVFQIGNEPDSFRKRYRPAEYGPEDFLKEWNTFHDAIVAAVPTAKFAGPDISNKFPFLTAFAAEAPKHPNVLFLTGHYYAMGPASNPNATLDQLFEPDPKLATIHQHNLPAIEEAIKTAKLPFRMSEGNSCWDGGKPGVSDTLASALWCADMMLRFAQMGWVGVNLHGGGNGFYTPIAGTPSTGLTRRPEYFGIQFAQTFVGATFLPATLTGAGTRATAYMLEQHGKHRSVIFNKQDTPLTVELPSPPKGKALTLTGPGFDSKDGITLSSTHLPHTRTLTVPARTAISFEL
ncbi:hypothetical protein FTO74_06260 [Granulicella sp. WH15]|uniref:hypothetical protein n=1 Tax=Granulicella sp. WH15 TaxID=2602070 RepID=UPI001366C759|nr:hypothetical protein [Granulicella sp. WH15]QHN03018.1 hypothetical protein FTO74_06260 [Granulicella sp. WH15]